MNGQVFLKFLLWIELQTPLDDPLTRLCELLLREMLVAMDDLHHHLAVMPHQLSFNLELLDDSQHFLLYDLIVDHRGKCNDLLELAYHVLPDALSKDRLVENQHGVQVLHSLGQLLLQFVKGKV